MTKLQSDYYIPWVFKDKFELLYELKFIQSVITRFGTFDSTRYLDLYPNGKKYFETPRDEMYDLLDEYMQTDRLMGLPTHVENGVYDVKPVFEVRCFGCGFVEQFMHLEDIPNSTHQCPCCQQVTVLYTGDVELETVDNVNTIDKQLDDMFDEIIEYYDPESGALA